MASGLAKLSSSRYELKYTWQNDIGGPDQIIKTGAQVLADCEPGPLRDFLERILQSSDPGNNWDAAPGTPFFTIYFSLQAGDVVRSHFFNNAGAPEFRVSSDNNNVAIIELRYQRDEWYHYQAENAFYNDAGKH